MLRPNMQLWIFNILLHATAWTGKSYRLLGCVLVLSFVAMCIYKDRAWLRYKPRIEWRGADPYIGWIALAVVICSICVGISFLTGRWSGLPKFLLQTPLGLVWCCAQQYLLMVYQLSRLRSCGLGVKANGFLFGAIHAPNIPLALITGFGGWLLSKLYLEGKQNIFYLGLIHIIVSLGIRLVMPPGWMRIGVSYIQLILE